MKNKKSILVCPLNWGLGHASRVIPIINILHAQGFDVKIATSGESYNYLKNEFSQIEVLEFPGYNVKYSAKNSQFLKMLLLIPKIIFWTVKEHIILKKLIKQYQIDIVISDNRFGLWNRKIYSVFITHQLKVKFPGVFNILEIVYQQMLKLILKKYNECWIPDLDGDDNLSGELSHINNSLKNKYFIGPLSRFNLQEGSQNHNIEIDVLFILSGIEPQRTLFEEIIFKQVNNESSQCVVVGGTNKKLEHEISIPYYYVLNSDDLLELISKSEIVICRSGYSSVMDLISLQKRAVLVPTPGQTEQEYLAKYLNQKRLFYSMNQNEFDLNKAISNCYESPKLKIEFQNDVLLERIKKLKE